MSATEDDNQAINTPPLRLEGKHVNIDDSSEDHEDAPQVSIALQRNKAGQTKITAKGTGEIAEQILKIAFDQGVKVRTDSDLAEILSSIDVECEVPLEALTAVATILNYVYDAQKITVDEPVNKI